MSGFFEKCDGGLESNEDFSAEAGGQDVGATWASIGIVNEGFLAEFVTGVNGRQRGESTHAENRVRTEFTDDFFRGSDGLIECPEEGNHFRRKRFRFSNRRDDFEIEVRVFRGCLGVDFLLRDQQ